MKIPQDFEYIARRPGNPATHSLGNGCAAHPNAARDVMRLAQEWLKEVPFVGIQVTRFNILIIVSKDGSHPGIDQFHQSTQKRISGCTIIHETPQRLAELLAAYPEYPNERAAEVTRVRLE